jgi:hypothetical protein
MIQVGRAERVVVIAGDSASSDTLMPWLGNGFRILGAATTRGKYCFKYLSVSLYFTFHLSPSLSLFPFFSLLPISLRLPLSLPLSLLHSLSPSLSLLLSLCLASVEEASQPFSKCRSGMILGSGGIGIILESEDGARRRFMNAVNSGLISPTDVTIKKAIPFK